MAAALAGTDGATCTETVAGLNNDHSASDGASALESASLTATLSAADGATFVEMVSMADPTAPPAGWFDEFGQWVADSASGTGWNDQHQEQWIVQTHTGQGYFDEYGEWIPQSR